MTQKVDQQGRVAQTQVAAILPISYQYDLHGRLASITQGSRISSFAYDAQGNFLSVTDPLSRMVAYGYDTAGRIVSQTAPDGSVRRYSYDANGNVTSVTPNGGPNHDFTFTPVNLESAYTPPDIGIGATTTTHSYNLDKALTAITRPDGKQILFAYDLAGRINSVTSPDATYGYAYSAGGGCCGNPSIPATITRTASGGTAENLTNTYDGPLHTSTTWSGSINGSVVKEYDNYLRLTSLNVNGANVVNNTYDNDGYLSGAGAMTITRDAANGFITATTLGSVTASKTYTTFAETATSIAKYGNAVLYNATYTRDNLGRITKKVENVQGVTATYDYVYDTAGNLSYVSKDGVTVSSYAYDSNGNRTAQSIGGVSINSTYDAQDRLITDGINGYTYTSNGELSTKAINGQATSYVYDAEGNIVSVARSDGTLIEYIIDGQGRRIGKKVNGITVKGWLYLDGLKPVAELDGGGNLVAVFVYATRENTPDYVIRGGLPYRIITDHLGSPRLIVDTATGIVAQRVDYGEYGNVISDSAPGFTPFGFAGGFYDPDTGLVRFGARDYDAEIGRWTTKDPIGFRGENNFYRYVLNDPINLVDWSGLDFTFPENPSGLGPEWVRDYSHRGGEKYINKNTGEWIRFEPAKPGKGGWKEIDHWHDERKPYEHYESGQKVPDFEPLPPKPGRIPIPPLRLPFPPIIIMDPRLCEIMPELPWCDCPQIY
ncbi:MAG: RHS repeat protein [Nitrospinae bacterium]|nr:RHS repeat protein [Nitrospinota bacterium]